MSPRRKYTTLTMALNFLLIFFTYIHKTSAAIILVQSSSFLHRVAMSGLIDGRGAEKETIEDPDLNGMSILSPIQGPGNMAEEKVERKI